jgi:hypothetical protein
MARANTGSRSRRSSPKPGSSSAGNTGSRSSSTSARSKRTSQPSRRSSSANRSDRTKQSSQNLPDYSIVDPEQIEEAVDVYVDAPVVQVEEIEFEIDDLRAHVALLAEAGHFVQINAGVAVRLGKVELDIKGVETQALLEVRLRNVSAILERVLTSLDRNPDLLESVGEALGDVGGGAHNLLTDTGDVVKSAGKGAESALQDVGRGAGKGVAGIGQGGAPANTGTR